jgi:hypothetical protein
MKTKIINYIDKNSKNECEIFQITNSEGEVIYERDYTSQTDSIESYIEDYLDTLFVESQESFDKLISLYDVADLLEDIEEEEEAQRMRLVLNSISKFFIKTI